MIPANKDILKEMFKDVIQLKADYTPSVTNEQILDDYLKDKL